MNESAVNRRTSVAVWALALGPLLVPALLMAAAFHLRIRLGHWAVPMVDDYHGHGTVFFWFLVLAVVPAIPFWIIMLFSSLTRLPLRQRVFHIATYFASWALFALYCRIDPWRYIEWYLD